MDREKFRFSVSTAAIKNARRKFRLNFALTIALIVLGLTIVELLFSSSPAFDNHGAMILFAISMYVFIYFLAKFMIKDVDFSFIEMSQDGLHFIPYISEPIPWNQIDSIGIFSETQANTGDYVQIDIKREFYRTMNSQVFDFAKDEKKRLFTCSIYFHLGILEETPDSFEQAVAHFAPRLIKRNTSG